MWHKFFAFLSSKTIIRVKKKFVQDEKYFIKYLYSCLCLSDVKKDPKETWKGLDGREH